MEPEYISEEPMTYKDALRMAYEVLEEKKKKVAEQDTLGLGLAQKYDQAIALLARLWLRDII